MTNTYFRNPHELSSYISTPRPPSSALASHHGPVVFADASLSLLRPLPVWIVEPGVGIWVEGTPATLPADIGDGSVKVIATRSVASPAKIDAVVKFSEAAVSAAKDPIDLGTHGSMWARTVAQTPRGWRASQGPTLAAFRAKESPQGSLTAGPGLLSSP